MATPGTSAASLKSFQSELENFLIHLPGGGSVSLTDDENMEAQMLCHYGDWRRKPGSVTPIPLVRVPRLFLEDSEMPEFFKKRYRSLQQGEKGEIHIYKCVLGLSSLNFDEGLALFPNVDSHCFKHLEGHVEIDMVLVHPSKGIFVFNVKNAEKIDAEKDIVPDVIKHSKFVRRLCQATEEQLPINTVVCSLKKNLDPQFQSAVREKVEGSRSSRDSLIFLNVSEINEFSSNWREKVLPYVGDFTKAEKKLVTIATNRLFGLNIMTESLFHIHNKFVQSGFQKTRKKEKDFAKMTQEMAQVGSEENDGPRCDDEMGVEQLTEDLAHLSAIGESSASGTTCGSPSSKQRHVILWTEEQIKVIAAIMKVLHQAKGAKGGRFVVEGCKGSGKTLIMTQIAILAKRIPTIRNVVIGDGRLGQSIVFEDDLRRHLQDCDVTVASTKELVNETKGCQLLMFDECNRLQVNAAELEKYASPNTHLILFASRSMEVGKAFRKLKLGNALRMSVDLAKFAEEFRSLHPTHELELQTRHNVIGSAPEVEIVEPGQDDLYHKSFVDACVANIEGTLNKSQGLKSILTAPFVHALTLRRILDGLHDKGIQYHYRNPMEVWSPYKEYKSKEDSPNTWVLVGTGNHIDGAEFGAVLVLVDASLPAWWSLETLHGSMFIAMTRATVYLKILYNASPQAPACNSIRSNEGISMALTYEEKMIDRPTRLKQFIEKKAKEFADTIGPILFIGNLPHTFTTTECPFDFTGMGYNWHTASNNKLIVSGEHLSFAILMKYRLIPSVIIMSEGEALSATFLRHAFLYSVVENPAWVHVPIIKVGEKFSKSHFPIKQFIKTRASTQLRNAPFSDEANDSLPSDAWKEVKQLGNELFKYGNYPDAVKEYRNAIDLINREYNSSFHRKIWSVHESCKLRSQLAKVLTNLILSLSKVDDGEIKSGQLCLLDHAKKAILADPLWDKGWWWAKKIWRALNMDDEVEERQFREQHGLNKEFVTRAAVIQDKIRSSASWHLLRFKENAYLIDPDGNGNYTSIQEALYTSSFASLMNNSFSESSFSYCKPLDKASFLLLPGCYRSTFPVFLHESSVDIVGDWNPTSDGKTGHLSADSPVILTMDEIAFAEQAPANIFISGGSMSGSDRKTVRIARVFLVQEKSGRSLPANLIYNTGNGSKLELLESSINSSQDGQAAVAGGPDSDMRVDRCRFIGGFHPILATGNLIGSDTPDRNAFLKVSLSSFIRNSIQCIEVRSGASAEIQNCHFEETGRSGVTASSSPNINIAKCTFTRCSTNQSASEGALQFHGSNVTVKDTHIQQQKGNGLVIEGGQGELEGLTITHCGVAGILAFAPLEITDCKISHVEKGVEVCENAEGDIIMRGNVISDCSQPVSGKGPKSKKPIMKGVKHEYSRFGKNQLERAALETHLKLNTRTRKELLRSTSIRSVPQHEFDRGSFANLRCERCSAPVLASRLPHAPRTKCGLYLFCSETCRKNNEDFHQRHCRECWKQ